MKNLLKKGLISVALLSAVVVNASEKLNVKVASAAKMLSIELRKVNNGESIAIKDLNGEVLFFERLKEASEYSKIFSVSTLPEGLYFVESKDSSKIEVTPVLINKDGAALVENAAKKYLAPTISLQENLLKVKVRNYSKVPVTITVFDALGAVLSKSESNTNALVVKAYNLSDLNSKNLIVSVREGDYTFTEEIKL